MVLDKQGPAHIEELGKHLQEFYAGQGESGI